MAIEEKDFYEMKAKIEALSDTSHELKARITDVERKQETLYEMNKNIALMAQSLKQVEGDVSEVKVSQHELSDKVSALENAPAQETLNNIKKIKIAAITAIATMVTTGVASIIIVQLAK